MKINNYLTTIRTISKECQRHGGITGAINFFINLFLAVLGLLCCLWASLGEVQEFSSCNSSTLEYGLSSCNTQA